MTLILKFDLDMVKMYLHAKNEVSMSHRDKPSEISRVRCLDTGWKIYQSMKEYIGIFVVEKNH